MACIRREHERARPGAIETSSTILGKRKLGHFVKDNKKRNEFF